VGLGFTLNHELAAARAPQVRYAVEWHDALLLAAQHSDAVGSPTALALMRSTSLPQR
jgi:hypothetical protein